MHIDYLFWKYGETLDKRKLSHIDHLSVHYRNGDARVYSKNDLQSGLIERIYQSDFLFLVINLAGGSTQIYYPESIACMCKDKF